MPQLRPNKFAAAYKQKSDIDSRALRGYRRSLDWKQSRSQVVGQRRNIMDASAISPVAESRPEAAPTKSNQQPAAKSSASGEHKIIYQFALQCLILVCSAVYSGWGYG